MRAILALLFAALPVVLAPSTAALIPHIDVHDFEGIGDGRAVGAYYGGYAYDGGVVVACDQRGGGCGARDVQDGVANIAVDPAKMFTQLSGFCIAGAPSGNMLLIDLTDLLGGHTRAVCRSTIGTNVYFDIASGLPVMHASLSDSSGLWEFDDLRFSTP
jgi:hypothetical protein